MLSRPVSTTPDRLARLTLFAAGAGVLLCGAMLTRLPDPGDGCRVGVGGLDGHARTLVARRVMACNDYEHGRITKPQYLETIARIDAEFARPPLGTNPRVMWASSVLGFSTQYSDSSWSALQATGAPNVFPRHGDLAQAWASHSADDHAEWIELGYETPRRVSAVEIYETYNPGAVDTVELITTSGRRIELRPASSDRPAGVANKLVLDTPCTAEPVAAVRVNVASPQVEGWNEIDAVGLVPCAEP